MERQKTEDLFLMVLIGVLGWMTFLIFRPLLNYIIIGFLLAFAFQPLYQRFVRKFKRRGMAATLVILIILGIVLIPFAIVTALLLRDVTRFANEFDLGQLETALINTIHSVASILGVETTGNSIEQQAAFLIDSIAPNVTQFLTNFAASLPSLIVALFLGIFVVLFTLFYAFIDGQRFADAIRNTLPLHRGETNLLFREFHNTVNAVFIGHILVSLIQAGVGTVGFLIFGVPEPFFWGFVMLIFAILPVIGPFLVWLPVGLYMVAVGDTFSGVGVLLWGGILVSSLDNVIRPKLIGSRADIHPFLVLVGVIGGLFVFGFTGFIVGPLVVSMFLSALKVYRHEWETARRDEWDTHPDHDLLNDDHPEHEAPAPEAPALTEPTRERGPPPT